MVYHLHTQEHSFLCSSQCPYSEGIHTHIHTSHVWDLRSRSAPTCPKQAMTSVCTCLVPVQGQGLDLSEQ